MSANVRGPAYQDIRYKPAVAEPAVADGAAVAGEPILVAAPAVGDANPTIADAPAVVPMNTKGIYQKIARNTPLKPSAVKSIVEEYLDEAFAQARAHGQFEMAFRMKIAVTRRPAVPAGEQASVRTGRVSWRRAKPAKTTIKISPMAHMRRKIL